MVQEMGLEPTQDCSHKHLKLARLPIPPPLRVISRHFRRLYHYITLFFTCQYLFTNFFIFLYFLIFFLYQSVHEGRKERYYIRVNAFLERHGAHASAILLFFLKDGHTLLLVLKLHRKGFRTKSKV